MSSAETETAMSNSIASMSFDTSTSSLDASKITLRSCAVLCLALSVQEWSDLGLGEDPSVMCTENLDEAVERCSALLLARILAITPNDYKDLSTSTIGRTILVNGVDAAILSENAIEQLHHYVGKVLSSHRNLPFHNWQHTYHMIVSANKLIDLMLAPRDSDQRGNLPPTFGLRSNPIALLSLIFSALIRDIDHRGVTNRQLAMEGSKYALIYNDSSIQEQRAVSIAFHELLHEKYDDLRNAMFPSPGDYRYFRSLVVSAVLSTDLGSPERLALTKSKFKEAFGELYESGGAPTEILRRGSMMSNISMPRGAIARMGRRGSTGSNVSDISDYSFSRRYRRSTRRMSNASVESNYSEYANDSVLFGRKAGSSARRERRASIQSVDSNYSDFVNDSVCKGKQNSMQQVPPSNRRASMGSQYSDFALDSVRVAKGERFAPSKRLTWDKSAANPTRNAPFSRRMSSGAGSHFTNSDSSEFPSFGHNSISLAHGRLEKGRGVTRHRSADQERFRSDSHRSSASPKPEELLIHDNENGVIDIDDDDSLSITPPSSDEEYGGIIISGVTLTESKVKMSNHSRRLGRRMSTGAVPVRFGPLTGEHSRIEEMVESDKIGTGNLVAISGHRKRLGIRRSMDLSGEAIELYSRSSIGTRSGHDSVDGVALFDDQPDEMKASVVIELLLRASQTSHLLQGWDNLTKWSGKLFFELCRAHKKGRGHDPRETWFDNQTKIMDAYLEPLALQLEQTGVFGHQSSMFIDIIENNREYWLLDGFEFTENLIADANEAYYYRK